MEGIKVRRATPNDLPTLRLFEQGVIEAERPFDPTLKPGNITYYDLELLMTSTQYELVVAEYNGRLIGSGYARIEKSKHYLAHSHHAYLGFMYVLPEFRGKGVIKKILEELKSWSKSRNILELRLEVYSKNTAAIRAYEKAGFEANLIEMRMGINDAC